MPIYEYQCQSCGHVLEKLQKVSDEPLTLCPECGVSALAKQVSLTSFKLKGSGWYETDFKGKSSSQKGAGKTEATKAEATTTE